MAPFNFFGSLGNDATSASSSTLVFYVPRREHACTGTIQERNGTTRCVNSLVSFNVFLTEE